jgi:hypothetical protein
MKMPWSQEAVRILPAKIDLSKQPWCRAALLLQVQGTGVLRWERRLSPPDADPYESDYCLTLRDIPLLSWHSPVCETCESWLATGWGLDSAECPEMDALRETLNGGFTRLENAVPALSPLLELLPSGVYMLAESDAYPADGSGRFFWDVPDQLSLNHATAITGLDDDDYEYQYESLPPVFLYPSQQRSRLNLDRVNYYQERFQSDGPLPHGIAIGIVEGVSVLLDGHHKAAAAALLGRTLPCLTVLRLEHYQMQPGTVSIAFRRYTAFAGCFGPIEVPIKDMGGVKLPEKPWILTEVPEPLPAGRLADTELPKELRAAGAQYPTAQGYALVTAADIGYPTDEDLETWLAEPYNYRPQLRAALVLLRSCGDPRLKRTALRCAAIEDRDCSLKEEAFQVLAGLKGDPDAEAFFIDYFVNLEGPPRTQSIWEDHLTNIAHSFWN